MADQDRRDADAAERFDGYLEALLRDRRPSPDAVSDREQAEVARMAAELAAAGRDRAGTNPDPAFLEQLRHRMRAADAGIATVRTSAPVRVAPVPDGSRPWRLSRRSVLQAGLGTAGGLAAGVLGVTLRERASQGEAVGSRDGPLVAGDGHWTEVATLAELPPGSVLRFSTAAFEGFVVNDGGEVRAMSSVCTHMGCTLHFRPDSQDLRCPCHGASFDLAGRLANGRQSWRGTGPYRGDATAYPVALPDLPRPRVKVDGDRVLVWTAQV